MANFKFMLKIFKKDFSKKSFFKAFSLIEVLISLIIVSTITAAFTPVISKKLQQNSITAGGASTSIIKSDCEKFSKNGGTCHTCFNNACIVCEYENCSGYLNVGKCQCESCTLRSANCIKCNSKECTKCKEHYYLDSNKKCQSCPSGKYCDGSSNPMNCSRINSNCITCSSSSICTKCNSGYYLNSAKTSCTKCEAGNYCNGQTKSACGDRTYAAAGASSCSSVTNVSNCVSYSKTENRCTACNSGYYLSNNTCQKCPRGSYCNGLTKTTCPNGQYTDTEGNSSCQTCPAGYYCQSGFKTACAFGKYSSYGASSCTNSSYSSNCANISKTENKCYKCNSGYYLNGNGCSECPIGSYCSDGVNRTVCAGGKYNTTVKQTSCLNCPSGYYCQNGAKYACASGTYSTGSASSCTNSSHSANCVTLNQTNGLCTNCNSGYYLNNGSCAICPAGYYCVNNSKAVCPDGKYNASQGNTTCANCPAGYYCKNGVRNACASGTYSTGSASSCANSSNGANCATINSTTGACSKCNSGYKISGNGCVVEFDCSGQYFMQIGNLCVTKYNMGDSSETAIPSSAGVNVVGTGQTCGSSDNYTTKCCWQGKTSDNCDAANGNYSGCNRTVCNWAAANAICVNYKKEGASWRLAINSEMSNWSTYSIGKRNNGLMLGDFRSGYSSALSENSRNCLGSLYNICNPYEVWSGSIYNSTSVYSYSLVAGKWYGPSRGPGTYVYSVRCVTEM